MLGLGRVGLGEIFGEDDGHDEDDSHDGDEGNELLEEEEQDIGVRWGEARRGDKRGACARGGGGAPQQGGPGGSQGPPRWGRRRRPRRDLALAWRSHRLEGRHVGTLDDGLTIGGRGQQGLLVVGARLSRGILGDFFLDSTTALFSRATPVFWGGDWVERALLK
ncbi:hypothetical protein NL676_002915 [Syzygium grande]|nr:hypothetical protein NL676_002915 [Syzygium grande]